MHKEVPAADDGSPPQARQSAQVGDQSAVAEPPSLADDDVRSVRSDVSGSTVVGDSIYTESEPDEAAVAASASADADDDVVCEAQPTEIRATREERPLRDTAPKQSPVAEKKWAARNAAAHVGNIGWLFGNWGKRPSDVKMRDHLDHVLKKQPAMIIGLAECEKVSEDVLRSPPAVVTASPPAAVAAPAAADAEEEHFGNRQSFEYITLRGNEDSSILIGLRKQVGNTLDLLNWERRFEGTYSVRRGGTHRKVNAYSRSMVVEVTTDQSIGFLGTEHRIMLVHMHNILANGRLGVRKLEAFWAWLYLKCSHFKVQVLMGDFNMCLFRVIPELRSRGVVIDLAAWYPWKSLDGTPMSDSCGIFFIDTPGVYKLNKSLEHLHHDDRDGILHPALPLRSGQSPGPAVAGRDGDYDRIETNGGPGMSLKTYLPKAEQDLQAKLIASLTPSKESAAVAGEANPGRAARCIKLKEKRLKAQIWRCEGQHQKGSHFPICVFTDNVGRRSPGALEERKKNGTTRKRPVRSGEQISRAPAQTQ